MAINDPCDYTAWPAHVAKALHAEGVQTWGDLSRLPAATLLSHPRVGGKGLTYVKRELGARGLSLAGSYRHPLLKPTGGLEPVMGVYFVRCGDFVKIGHARNIRQRVQYAMTFVPYPVELMRHVIFDDIKAAIRSERAFHKQFAHLRHAGEWFRLDGELATFLRTGDA